MYRRPLQIVPCYRCWRGWIVEKKSDRNPKPVHAHYVYYNIIHARNVQLVVWSATLLFPGGSERGWKADSHHSRPAAADAAARRLVVWCDASPHARPTDQCKSVCFCAGKWLPWNCTTRYLYFGYGWTTTTIRVCIILYQQAPYICSIAAPMYSSLQCLKYMLILLFSSSSSNFPSVSNL